MSTATDFSDLEDAQEWTKLADGKPAMLKADFAQIEHRVAAHYTAFSESAPFALGATRSVATIAKYPCSKCSGSGRFISWAGRDCGACNRCHGTGKQKTDPNAARERVERKRLEEQLRVSQLASVWRMNNPEMAEWLRVKSASFDFAKSMLDALAKWGSLTDNQLAAVQKCMQRDVERAKAFAERKPDADVAGAGFERMVKAFAAAKASGLRRPKFRVGEYEFSPAGPSSANAGCLYVKRGEVYVGKITGAGAFFASRDASDEDKLEIARIGADPLAAAVMHGKQTGRCSCCDRLLTNEESVRLGIGPICRGKWGL